LPVTADRTDVALRNETAVVDVDSELLVDRVGGAVSGTLHSLVEYDSASLNVVYADDATLAFYRDRDHLLNHFERVHSHAHVDFEQTELFADDLRPVADRVERTTTAMDFMTLVRVRNERNGLFVGVDSGQSVQPVVDAIRGLPAAGR
jgi:hypothetical protein